MSAPIVLLDACVLYPAALRDLFMRLTVHELIRAKWSEKIHDEWITAVLRERPDLTRPQLERTRALMNLHGGDCLVEGYEHRINALTLPDVDDRHVLAAAVESEADAIVTWNLSDFPASALDVHSIALWTPDMLMMGLLAEHKEAVIDVMRGHRASLRNPPRTTAEYLETLSAQGLKQSVEVLGAHLGEI